MRDFPDFSLDELSSMNQNITAGLAQLDMEPEPAPPDENVVDADYFDEPDLDTMKIIGIQKTNKSMAKFVFRNTDKEYHMIFQDKNIKKSLGKQLYSTRIRCSQRKTQKHDNCSGAMEGKV